MSTKLTGYVWDGCAASGMKLSSVAIMARLADFSNDEGVCWPSIETIARQIGAGMSTVRTAIARLEAEGWLTRKARRQGTRAWTYRHWMGTGTVGVMIASSDLINPIPEESTETAARQHIEPLAPVAGSDLYVFRPVAHKVDFHIRVTPDTPEIRAAITAELRSFLLRDGYPQGELKVSRISEAISGANGEYSHQLLAPADNISIAKNELAVLGTISWT
ncbi:TPA: baseplate J/gp47 family protein [Escherichia coli]